jgi:LAS superfamily LD-carboxypeptidase LdcB
MVKGPYFLLASFICAAILASGFYLSFAYQKNLDIENLVEEQVTMVSKASISGEVLNASYSAVPLVKENVVSQKGFVDKGTVTLKGDDFLVLVNKSIGLPASYTPADLLKLQPLVQSYPGAFLRKEAASQLVSMFNNAKASGYSLTVTSAYRSWSSQQATYTYWVRMVGTTNASQISARPGHSQHQLGTAVDLSATNIKDNLNADFGKSPEGLWLASNSYKYGYVLSYPAGKEAVTGYAYEPWHFRYIGVESANHLHSLGWDLETYLEKYGVW